MSAWGMPPGGGWRFTVRLFGQNSADGRTELARATLRRGAASVEGTKRGESAFRRSIRQARVEAALIVADSPLSARRLAQCASLLDSGEARQIVDRLNELYDASKSSFRIERVGSGFQLLTRPVFARWLDRIHQRQERLKLSPSVLETLTVVAYRQPITRAEIESLRGVQSAELLKQLMERNLVKIVGEDDSLGRPYLYGTTRNFLESYGLRNLDELPDAELLRRPASKVTPPAEGPVEASDESPTALAG
jgi:segregation and condensation protein B